MEYVYITLSGLFYTSRLMLYKAPPGCTGLPCYVPVLVIGVMFLSFSFLVWLLLWRLSVGSGEKESLTSLKSDAHLCSLALVTVSSSDTMV